MLAKFRDRHPGIEIAVRDTLADQCKALVRSREVDFAIATAADNDADLESEFLCADSFYLVCPADHALARKRGITLRDLAAWPFVHLSRNSSVRQHLEAAFHPAQMRTVAEVEHLATVTGLVAAGLGITVVPALTLFHFDRKELAVRPLELPGLVRKIVLLRRRHESLSSGAQALYALMLRNKPSGLPGKKPRK